MPLAEIELKLEISPADLEKIALSSFLGEPAATLELHSVYFDTGDCRLFDNCVSADPATRAFRP
jgi:inorganic triphosphatase YgiF